MANWLNKYEQGGLVLKKKTKDNYGKKANPNDVKVSAGPDFVGEGYTAYNWKSPSWGGQFKMGGSMPGSVGFMYARTQNPAPSNGKYTKKTQASAQNGQEMKYYQDGLDFRPKSISQNGTELDPELFNMDTKAAQDATRNVVPRKMTAAEKKEAQGKAASARANTAKKNQEIIAERKRKTQTKGDINTPGSWNTAEKLRMFPESVGGLGEMYDDYINPAMMVGSMADMLGESIAARDPKMAALALGMSAGLGALGVDPLGTALKYKNAGSKYIKALQQEGVNVQTAGIGNPFRGTPARATDDPMAAIRQDYTQYIQERDARNAAFDQRMAARRQQLNDTRVPYQPPTDAELLAMNQVEANRYFRRPAQPTNIQESISRISDAQRRAGADNISNPETQEIIQRELQNIEELSSRTGVDLDIDNVDRRLQPDDLSVAADDALARYRARATPRTPTEAELADLRRQYPVDRNIQSGLQRAADDIYERTFAPAPQPQPMSESLQRALRDIDMEPSTRDWDSILTRLSEDDLVDRSAYSQSVNPAVPEGPKFGDENFKIGQGTPGRHRQTDASGNSFEQRVEDYGNIRTGTYKVTGPDGGYMEIDTRVNPNDPDGYLKVSNMTFRSEDEKIAAGQLKKIFSHLPPKLDMGYISTSMYSQPLTDAQIARWANNQPGRIELKNIQLTDLNTWHKNKYDAIYDASTGEAYGDYLTQLKRQFPRLQKTAKKVSETTGYALPEPKMVLDDPLTGGPVPITMDDLNSSFWKNRFAEDPYLPKRITILAPKYQVKKNWKNGGNIVDPMGQWAHPGKVTTIPGNDITMKGVNYDVLGVSNTGDKKLMKPGKNYKFDGDYVTEYPKGGWLNKYK